MVVDEIFSEINDEVIILKDYLGAAWLKEWNLTVWVPWNLVKAIKSNSTIPPQFSAAIVL